MRAVKIGRPGYRVTKQFDAVAQQRSLLFQVGFVAALMGKGAHATYMETVHDYPYN